MASKKIIKLNLAEKLKNKAYRLAFFRARAQDDTAANIRSLRERRELSQTELAKLARMKQSAISRIEQAEYSSWTYKTLQRVAEALEARLVVIFEPAEDVIARYENMENFQSLTASAKTSVELRNNLANELNEYFIAQGSSGWESDEGFYSISHSEHDVVDELMDNSRTEFETTGIASNTPVEADHVH